jgi:hypothetical protein
VVITASLWGVLQCDIIDLFGAPKVMYLAVDQRAKLCSPANHDILFVRISKLPASLL